MSGCVAVERCSCIRRRARSSPSELIKVYPVKLTQAQRKVAAEIASKALYLYGPKP
jgi:hypothetical protein